MLHVVCNQPQRVAQQEVGNMAAMLGLGGAAGGAGAAAGAAGAGGAASDAAIGSAETASGLSSMGGAASSAATGGWGSFMQNIMNSQPVQNAEKIQKINGAFTGGGIGSLGSKFQQYSPQLGPATFMDLITQAHAQAQQQQPNQGQVQNGQYQF